jgi:hypothetical protein
LERYLLQEYPSRPVEARVKTVFDPASIEEIQSTKEWGRLVYLHNDHHLRQFGV